MFALQGNGPNIKVLSAPPPQPRPARPVQVGGASSSSGPAERQPRPIEVDPHAPCRRFPNDQRARYRPNPARHARYEAYQGMATVGEVRRLGATLQDFSMDVAAGAITLL